MADGMIMIGWKKIKMKIGGGGFRLPPRKVDVNQVRRGKRDERLLTQMAGEKVERFDAKPQ
jgi:hypothetical protein